MKKKSKFKKFITILTFSIGVDVLGFPILWKHKLSNLVCQNNYNEYYNSYKRFIKSPTI
jgi:hypothetical protein